MSKFNRECIRRLAELTENRERTGEFPVGCRVTKIAREDTPDEPMHRRIELSRRLRK